MSDTPPFDEALSKSLCPLPFLHAYVKANGRIAACCESQEFPLTDQSGIDQWNGDNYRQLRLDLLRGGRPEICSKCWKNEAISSRSGRQSAWMDLSEGRYDRDNIQYDSEGVVPSLPQFIEIKCSNYCNLRCKMCHPSSSHSLIEDKEIISKYRPELVWHNQVLKSKTTISSLLAKKASELRSLSVLQFSGGEPLLHEDHYRLVRHLVQEDCVDLALRYSTNLSILPSNELLNLWKRFSSVNVKVSIDGLGEVYNYIRIGGSFDQLIFNLSKMERMLPTNVSMGLGFTTQAYNVFQIHEFLDYFRARGFQGFLTTHLLHSPDIFSIAVFPPEVRNRLIGYLDSGTNVDHMLDKIRWLQNEPYDEFRWQQFVHLTRDYEAKYPSKGRLVDLLSPFLDTKSRKELRGNIC